MSDPARLGSRLLAAALLAAGLLVVGCGGGGTKPPSAAPAPVAQGHATVTAPATPVADGDVAPIAYPGVQHQRYRYGPIQINPGQNRSSSSRRRRSRTCRATSPASIPT